MRQHEHGIRQTAHLPAQDLLFLIQPDQHHRQPQQPAQSVFYVYGLGYAFLLRQTKTALPKLEAPLYRHNTPIDSRVAASIQTLNSDVN